MFKVKNKKIFLYIAVIGLLIFFHKIKVLSPIENKIINILNPVNTKLYSISSRLKLFYNKHIDQRDLYSLNQELKQKNNQLIIENSKLKSLKKENQTLRNYLSFLEKKEFDYVLANLISKSNDNFSDLNGEYITLNKGKKDDIQKGLAVVDDSGAVIGKIIKVDENISKACLITNKNCKLAVSIQNEESTAGITEGELGLAIKINFIPLVENIDINDTIITSGLEENIPYGLTVGKVIKVNKDNNNIWQDAIIEPLVDFNNLTIVSIIKI